MAKTARRTVVLLLICAYAHVLARMPAHAQFSLPYDPDFAEEPEAQEWKPPEPTKKPSEKKPSSELLEQPEEIPVLIQDAGPFLLMDRPDKDHVLTPPAEKAAPEPKEFGEFLLDLEPFRLDQRKWNRVREKVEKGTLPKEEFMPMPPGIEPFRIVTATEVPKPPPPELELPTYGTSLSITGRKVIGFNYSEKRYLHDQRTSGRPKSSGLLDIEQQLQLRMQGKVGPKITVNVDYDDTKTNKQDISVVYQGDPNEVVQNASFGDIDLSLPASEFVSYNKQLFGIRIEVKWKRLHAIFIGSRTKGTTKIKQFKGNTQFVKVDMLDTSYVQRKHYDLTYGDPARLPIKTGTERVFLSKSVAGTGNVDEIELNVDDLNVQSSTYVGKFVQLSAGVDYTVDYVKGVLTFRNILAEQDVVAVDFIDATGNSITVQKSTDTTLGAGGTGKLKLIKTFADVAISTGSEAGYRQTLKTFYSIGRTQIVRDDGRGNFFLKVLDKNRNEVAPTITEPGPNSDYLLKYPETIYMDFENGVFQLDAPFSVVGDTSTADPEVYARQAPIHKRLFQLELNFRLRTFFLEPSLVLQSEVVLLDGVRLTRNVDYFIDYESGFLTFFNENRIRDDSTIDVTYEVAPFAGIATESLLGGRVSYDIHKKWSVGSTILYQTGSKSPTVPTINELAKSLLVYELDTQVKDVRILSWLTGSFQGEVAQSRANPNLSEQALIDNMEGVKEENTASLFDSSWQLASNPETGDLPMHPDVLTLTTVDEQIKKINPNTPTAEEDSQKVLDLAYDFTKDSRAGVNLATASIVYSFSPTGLDFTQKTILEVTLFQAAKSDLEINFSLGGINEDADGDGQFDTEDQDLNGLLDPDEDKGYVYDPTGVPALTIGADNGRIDTEDLNQNGRLDPADFTGDNFGYLGQTAADQTFTDITSSTYRTTLDFGDPDKYHTFQIPLTTTDTTKNWSAIKQLRITIKQTAGGAASGSLRFARIAVIGNTWQRGQAGEPATGDATNLSGNLNVTAVNNVDNAVYKGREIYNSPGPGQDVFNTLYGSFDELKKQSGVDTLQEQALELRYDSMTPGTTVYTKRTFARAIDISQHHDFSFLVYGDVDGGDTDGSKTFFLRAGSDQDYFEVHFPITFTGWRKVTAKQVDATGDQVPDLWELGEGPPGAVVVTTGAPNLQQIGILTAGIISTGNDTDTKNAGAVWLNEIFVDRPWTRTGNAWKFQVDLSIRKWGTLGLKHRFMDRNFETPTTVVANQDNRQDNAYLNLTRLSFLPMNFTLSRSIVTTPNANATGDRSNLVNLLQEGKLVTWNGSASGNFQYRSLPRVGVTYTRNRTERNIIDRLDDAQTYNSNLSYGVPVRKFFLPKTVDLNYQYASKKVEFGSVEARKIESNYDSLELSQAVGARMTFAPWNGASINPDYSLTVVEEDRTTFSTVDGSAVRKIHYPKSMSQKAGFDSSWKLLKWLRPSLSYSISTIENNVLTPSTFTVGGSTTVFDIGDIKTVNRTASGNLGLTLNLSQVFPNVRLLRSFSLTNSYQLQDGDTWENVEKDLDTKTALWVRTPLQPSAANPAVQRTNLTLRDTFNSSQRWSPLESFDLKGRKSALKTFSISDNFVKSIQRSDKTGTVSKTITTTLPDLIGSMSQLEKLTFTDRWAKNMQLNLKYASRNTLNVGTSREQDDSFGTDLRAMIFKRFDTSISFNLRAGEKKDLRLDQVTQTTDHKDVTVQSKFSVRKFIFTPKVDYQKDVTTQGNGVDTQDITQITPSVLMRADLSLPKGLRLPLSGKVLKFTNRVIWTTTLSMAMRSSPVTVADNSRLLNLNTSADYEIAKNLRMSLNGAFSRLWHKFIKEDEYIQYQFGSTLTFQF